MVMLSTTALAITLIATFYPGIGILKVKIYFYGSSPIQYSNYLNAFRSLQLKPGNKLLFA